MVYSKFTLWPVGQGLFYSGEIEYGENYFNFIYDCGSESLKKVVDDYVNSLNTNKIIERKIVLDMLVVSHFDKDHISGLEFLFEKMFVKEIFLPYNNEDDFLLFVSYMLGQGIDLSKTKIVLIYSELRSRDIMEIDDTGFFIDLARNIRYHNYHDNSIVNADVSKLWQFKFYNAPIEKIAFKGIAKEFSEIVDGKKLSDVLKVKELRDRLKELYEKYTKSYLSNSKSNQSSLCLYHSPLSTCRDCTTDCFGEVTSKIEISNQHILGTLLTGDISLKSSKRQALDQYKKFKAHFESELQNTGMFLLPHHGSSNNWNKKVTTDFAKTTFLVSVGLGNKHRHPGKMVVDEILERGHELYISNQVQSINYEIDFEILRKYY